MAQVAPERVLTRGVIDVEREETSMMLPVREYVNFELSGALEPVFIPNVPVLVNTDPGGMLASEATGLLSETPLIGHSSAIVMGQGGELTEDMKSSLSNVNADLTKISKIWWHNK